MNKIAIVIISGLLVSGIVFVLVTQRPKNSISPATGVITNAPTANITTPTKLKTYTNPSGFSFKYPESFLLTEKKITDQSIYAWVELTDPQNKDIISIKLEDSDLTEIDDWFTASNKKDIKGEIKETKLADIDGRQFTDKENQLTTLALDQGGVLITITTDSLSSVHQQIVSSFIFIQPAQTTTGTSGGGEEDIVFEGEEVVE